MKIVEKEYNIQTGETIITERDETPQEQAQREAAEAEFAVRKAEAEAKAAQRQAVLNRLGITEEEARILLGGN
jgi:hypothetical protein